MGNIQTSLSGAKWHCEPPLWELNDNRLSLTTGHETDFWQGTLYGFRRDDGHFLGCGVEGDFTAILAFEADYRVLYDQAGLMLRTDAGNWLKTGIEYSDDVTNFSTVVTREGRSDWSVVSLPQLTGPQRVRLTRVGAAVISHFLGQDGTWQLMRLADFPEGAPVNVGPMACSPQREGLEVRFLDLEIGPPIDNPLHAS